MEHKKDDFMLLYKNILLHKIKESKLTTRGDALHFLLRKYLTH